MGLNGVIQAMRHFIDHNSAHHVILFPTFGTLYKQTTSHLRPSASRAIFAEMDVWRCDWTNKSTYHNRKQEFYGVVFRD